MNVGEMRVKISEVYDGIAWRARVWRMPDNQVIAIYHNFIETGRFNKGKKKEKAENDIYEQLNLFDFGLK